MKKISMFAVLLLVVSTSYSQDLRNTEWVKIIAIHKDGSEIKDELRRDYFLENYYFKDSILLTSMGHQYQLEHRYQVNNGMLILDDFVRYSIDTVDNMVLKLTEVSINPDKPDRELNTYGFIESDYLFAYLKQTGKLKISGDTLVDCDEQFSPVYPNGKLRSKFIYPFRFREDEIKVRGYFIINSRKAIDEVHIDSSSVLTRRQRAQFISVIKSTAGSWIIPKTDKSYAFKMHFEVLCAKRGTPGFFTNIKFNTIDTKSD